MNGRDRFIADHSHVSDIAFGCGFSTASHFCRTFRDQYGISPGEFRDRRNSRQESNP